MALANTSLQLKILYPVRDVRAVVASILNLKTVPIIENQTHRITQNSEVCGLFKIDVEKLKLKETPLHIKAALIWKIKSSLYQKFQEYGHDTLVFRYEDLVIDPDVLSRRLAEHCDLAYQDTLSSHHKIMRGEGPGGTLRSRKIDTASIKRWRETLSKNMTDDILEITDELMGKLGYL